MSRLTEARALAKQMRQEWAAIDNRRRTGLSTADLIEARRRIKAMENEFLELRLHMSASEYLACPKLPSTVRIEKRKRAESRRVRVTQAQMETFFHDR